MILRAGLYCSCAGGLSIDRDDYGTPAQSYVGSMHTFVGSRHYMSCQHAYGMHGIDTPGVCVKCDALK